ANGARYAPQLERQIRALNQSIKEQELALSLGKRPGTQLAPILLPEVIVPASRWTKRPNAMSDLDSDDEAPNGGLFDPNGEQRDGPTTLGIVPADSTPASRRQRRKFKSSHRNEPPPKLKITLPASAAPELFCYCRTISWGEMIACDNENCKNQWKMRFGTVGIASRRNLDEREDDSRDQLPYLLDFQRGPEAVVALSVLELRARKRQNV
ncbi:hypothetical protein MPER_00927, partial [Moniliophthora perniciosa FA553]